MLAFIVASSGSPQLSRSSRVTTNRNYEKKKSMAALNNLNQFYETVNAIKNDPNASRVFATLLEKSTSSGWALSRELTIAPEQVLKALRMLTSYDVIASKGSDMDAYYYVTGYGSEFRAFIQPATV